jgi:hypothetical protein
MTRYILVTRESLAQALDEALREDTQRQEDDPALAHEMRKSTLAERLAPAVFAAHPREATDAAVASRGQHGVSTTRCQRSPAWGFPCPPSGERPTMPSHASTHVSANVSRMRREGARSRVRGQEDKERVMGVVMIFAAGVVVGFCRCLFTLSLAARLRDEIGRRP